MLDKTWRWAGQFRKTDKNIGADWLAIPTQLQNALNDARYQIEHQTYSADDSCAPSSSHGVHIPFVNDNVVMHA